MAAAAAAQPAAVPPLQGGTASPSAPGSPPAPRTSAERSAHRRPRELCQGAQGDLPSAVPTGESSRRPRRNSHPRTVGESPASALPAGAAPRVFRQPLAYAPQQAPAGRRSPRQSTDRLPVSRRADTHREPLVAPGPPPGSRAAPRRGSHRSPRARKGPRAGARRAGAGGAALSPRSRPPAPCTKDLLFPGFLNLLIICRNINTSCLRRGQKEEPTRALRRAKKPERLGSVPPPV